MGLDIIGLIGIVILLGKIKKSGFRVSRKLEEDFLGVIDELVSNKK